MIETEVISETKKWAKAKMKCHACEWLQTVMSKEFYEKLTVEEQISVKKAARNKYQIIKGQQYWQYVTRYGNNEFTTTVLVKIHDICVKYNVYHFLKTDKELVKFNPNSN